MKTVGKLVLSSVIGLAVFALLVFAPAGTIHYWQGWVFVVVFALATLIPSVYFMRTNPAALQRRMRAGPFSEPRAIQKAVVSLAFASMAAAVVVSVFDHRFGWSFVPAAVCVLGDVLVTIGLGVAMLVIAQNAYAAATVTVEAGQKLASTGLYGLVRHPMYTGNVILMVGIPLALGSYWGLLFVIPGVAVLVLRIRDEEKMLNQELTGYQQYTQQVRYRMLPYVW